MFTYSFDAIVIICETSLWFLNIIIEVFLSLQVLVIQNYARRRPLIQEDNVVAFVNILQIP